MAKAEASGTVVLAAVDEGTEGWAAARAGLEAAGYQVVPAVPEVDLVAQVARHAPAIVLVAAAGALVPAIEGVPVVVVSREFEQLAGGLHDVLRAPVDAAEAVLRVRAAERVRALQDELGWRARELEELGRTDVLTGLANRRQIEEHLQMVSSGARRLRRPYSLLMADVDQFRRVNDAHGRPAGDTVLRAIAARINSNLRGEDVAGRWGGEEFLVVLPHTPLDGAWRLAERIRLSVSESPVELAEDRDVVVTISVGCGEGCGDDVEDHVRRTEAALDEAKSSGRNRVVADTTTVAP